MDDRRREYDRRYRERHPDRVHDSNRRYQRSNPEKGRIKQREYKAHHPDRVRANLARWRARNVEHRREYMLRWRLENADRIADYERAYKEDHRSELRARAARYAAAHLAERAARQNDRRVRQSGNGGSHTVQEWREKIELFAGCCVYCGEAKSLTRDHKIPLTRGGTDDIVNIVPACSSCNSRKGTRTAAEYLESLQRAG